MTEIRKYILRAQKTWFNEIMRETNASVADMAKAAGVTNCSLYQWRRGYRVIPMERAITMCEGLEIDPAKWLNRLIWEILR